MTETQRELLAVIDKHVEGKRKRLDKLKEKHDACLNAHFRVPELISESVAAAKLGCSDSSDFQSTLDEIGRLKKLLKVDSSKLHKSILELEWEIPCFDNERNNLVFWWNMSNNDI